MKEPDDPDSFSLFKMLGIACGCVSLLIASLVLRDAAAARNAAVSSVNTETNYSVGLQTAREFRLRLAPDVVCVALNGDVECVRDR